MTTPLSRRLSRWAVVAALCCLLGCSPGTSRDPKGGTRTAEARTVASGGNASMVSPMRPSRDPNNFTFFERPATLAAIRRSGTPSPVLVMLTSNPWAAVIGADSPNFALYDDGTVIYRTRDGYNSVKLNPAEQQAFSRQMDLAALSQAAGAYRADYATDQPQTYVLVY